MKERADILKLNQQLLEPGVDAALATVVRVQGSSYRRPGARMLIGGNGQVVGGVSGGCLERDVILRAGGVMESRQSALVRYDTTLDAEGGGGYSLGCGGVIDVFIEPLRTPGGVELIDRLQRSTKQPLALATVISKHHVLVPLGVRMLVPQSGRAEGMIANNSVSLAIASDARFALESGRSRFIQYASDGGSIDVFVESLQSPLKLFVFGAGHDAVPLARFAKSLGWHVTLVDVRSSQFDPGRIWEVDSHIRCSIGQVREHVSLDESAAAVVMTHNVLHDAQLIEWLGERQLRYLGLLGPRHRTLQILGDAVIAGLRSPVGLDLGADNPEEVALAIVAEITAVFHGRSGIALSEREGPIHAGSPQQVLSELKNGPTRPGSVVVVNDGEVSTCSVAGS